MPSPYLGGRLGAEPEWHTSFLVRLSPRRAMARCRTWREGSDGIVWFCLLWMAVWVSGEVGEGKARVSPRELVQWFGVGGIVRSSDRIQEKSGMPADP